MEYGCWPWIFIILLMISALIYGFEKAILGENETVLEDKAEEGEPHAVLLFKLYKQKASLTAIRILLMFGIGAGTGIHSMMIFQKYHSVYALAELPAIWLFLEILLLVIRKATVRTGEFWMGRFTNVIRVIMLFLKPLTFLVDLISDLLLRISGFETNLIEDVTEEEIISMVNEGNEQGVLEDSEAEMIQNIISFGDKEAGDIMTRRINVLAFEGHEPLLKVFDEMIDAGKSRFPVYDEELDNVIGVLYLHDVAKASRKEENHHKSLMEIPGLLREPVFIPETVNIDDLFRKMQHQKIHMMLVVDEYGQLDGLVTMEDLLEEIVGNIFDEYDEVEEPCAEQTGDNQYLIDGMAPVEEVEKLLNITMERDEDIETINGYLLYRLGYLPEGNGNDVVSVGDFDFIVTEVENKMIKKVCAVHKNDEAVTV